MSKRGANWTIQEDEALCAAWLATSQDASVGINQRASTLYERVYAEFVITCEERRVAGSPELRASSGVKARWLLINKIVGKFAGCVSQIEKRNQSGATPEDVLKQAVTLYAETERSSFTMMHCYTILQNAPKWQQYQTPGPKRGADHLNQPHDDEPAAPSSRPVGQKAAKARKVLAADNASLQMAKAGSILAAAAKVKIGHSKQKAQALTRIANHAIMSVNLEGLSETCREYYALEQKRILEETKSLVAKESGEAMSDDDAWATEAVEELRVRESSYESDDSSC